MHKMLRFAVILLLFVLLATIRFFEERLFYDPLLTYFKLGYLNNLQLPPMHLWKLLASVSFRFWLNSGISLLALYIAFEKIGVIKFSLLFYAAVFVLLIPAYFLLILYYNPDQYMSLFYVRRFLIQPLFIILLLPAFYYHNQVRK